jgi:hypothetical protein
MGLSRQEEDLRLSNIRHLQLHHKPRHLDHPPRAGDTTLRTDALVSGVVGKLVSPRPGLLPSAAGHMQPQLRHASPPRAVAGIAPKPLRGLGLTSVEPEHDRSGSLSHRLALRQSLSELPLALDSQRAQHGTPRQKGLPWGDKLSLLELQLQAADYGDTLRH